MDENKTKQNKSAELLQKNTHMNKQTGKLLTEVENSSYTLTCVSFHMLRQTKDNLGLKKKNCF